MAHVIGPVQGLKLVFSCFSKEPKNCGIIHCYTWKLF